MAQDLLYNHDLHYRAEDGGIMEEDLPNFDHSPTIFFKRNQDGGVLSNIGSGQQLHLSKNYRGS
jgi:hypothetical protein